MMNADLFREIYRDGRTRMAGRTGGGGEGPQTPRRPLRRGPSSWAFGAAIGQRREELGWSQERAAGLIGIARPTYVQIESGRKRSVSRDTIIRMADVYSMDRGLLLSLAEGAGRRSRKPADEISLLSTIRASPEIVPHPSIQSLTATVGSGVYDVPIMATQYIGGAGEMSMGEAIGYALRPRGIEHQLAVFALRFAGGSMQPVFRDGALLYADPGVPPRPGDDVLIELAHSPDSPSIWIVRRLVSIDDSGIVVEHFTPERTATSYLRSAMRRVIHILTLNELMGVP